MRNAELIKERKTAGGEPRPGPGQRWGIKPVVWVLALLPLGVLVWDGFTDGLGAEPIEEITHRTGFTALTMLMITLAVTPARKLTGWNQLIQHRRLLGLFAFFYATLHFSTYLFDQFFSLSYIIEDVLERPYITVGFVAFLLLIPLALTSTKGMIRRVGGKRWQRLHRLIYLAAALGVLHFLWLVKADLREPLMFAGILALLLALRIPGLIPPRKPKVSRG
jgi:sulfoxide reductase heme-binding subunit YedZ